MTAADLQTAEILIAEDSPTQAEQLTFLLSGAGYRVMGAADGERALALARERRPALVITDVVMPRMDGYALCEAIKSDADLRDTPVILLTSLASASDVVKGLACGADNFVRKPYDHDYLLGRVDQVLANVALRDAGGADADLEVVFAGQRHAITAERRQIFDFLFSTFEEAVQLNGELTRSYRSLDGLYRIAEGLNRCTTEQEVVNEALARALELPGAEAGWILVRDGESALRPAGSRARSGALPGDARECTCREDVLSGTDDDAANVGPCAYLARCGRAERAHASVPLRAGARVVGLMNLIGPEDGTFGDDALRTLDAVGNQVGAALERALLQEHLERRVQERTAALSAEVAARQRAEEALRVPAAIVEASDDGIVRQTTEGVIASWNPGAERLYGYTAEDAIGAGIEMLVPADRADEAAELLARVARGESVQGHETVRVTKAGEERDVSLTVSPVRDADAEVVGLAEIARDITQSKQLEAQLLRAQKMESIGRLAGGIAHDFNNLMTVVVGFSDLLLTGDEDATVRRDYTEEIKRAGERAIALGQQLLAFGRKQLLRPEVLDLNAVLADMEGLHKRLLGTDVDLRFIPGAGLSSVKVDRGHIEQVVMNLAINARDAMPDGGHLTIETTDVELGQDYADAHVDCRAGPYVLLTVSDTGTGMDARTQETIFEPFFTTKEAGKGTGLGLAVVFGIVKQSGGHISVYSEPGHGATFRIYLPATEEAPAERAPTAPVSLLRGSETVLVVEDEDGVRSFVVQLLRESGYTVLEAATPEDALALSGRYDAPIDLLITDMVMPHMSGRELADRLRVDRRETSVLYVSGYTGDAMIHRGLLEPGASFLAKPFARHELTTRVREILDDATSAPAPTGPRVRTVVADDDDAVRSMICSLLSAEPDFDVVGEAATTDAAIAAVEQHRPDLLLLDVGMPGGGGVVVSRAVAGLGCGTIVVALTGAADTATVREMLSAGSAGYLLKGTPNAELLTSLRETLASGPRTPRTTQASSPVTVGAGAITVLVVDDQAAVLDVLGDVIDAQPELALVGAALTPFHAVTLAARHQPQVAVLDAYMPSGGGARVAEEIRSVSPDTHIVALSGKSDRRTVMGMIRSGATSYVVKGGSHRRLVNAIVEAAGGGATMSSEVMTALLDELVVGRQGSAEAVKQDQARRSRMTALLNGEHTLDMHLQPIQDLDDRRTVGYEALARFPIESRRTPDVWFAEAARLGMQLELELLAIRRALAILPALPAPAWLSVNASPDTLMSDELYRLLRASEPQRIVVELTEHAPVADYEALTARVDLLRGVHVRLAVDDCGAGFASLKHVSLLRPDFIKLDVSLCRNLDDSVQSALVRALLAFGDEIGIHITAEGIETADDLDALRGLGLRYGQGYFLGRPAPFAG